MLTDEWQAALPMVRSPARYANAEWNSYRKPLDQASASAVLVYPDVYEAGVCDYGLALLYEILNEHPGFAADRAYLPWPDMREAMRSRGLLLSGIESGRPVRDFDLVGISLPNPLCFTAVPILLALAGLPVRQVERSASSPLIIGGGAAAANPEPVAELFDAILLGEGEEAILEIVAIIARTRGQDRRARQEALAAVPGVYVPAVHTGAGSDQCNSATSHRVVADFGNAPIPSRPVVPFVEALGGCACVEVSRGCACGWRFCPARHVAGEARRRAPDAVAEGARRALRSTGYDQVALFGADGCSPEQFAGTVAASVRTCKEGNASLTLPLMRPDTVRAVCAYLEGRPVDIEVGPPSERLRNVFRMGPCSEVLGAVEDAAAAGARTIRLHVLIGYPTETDDDVREAAAFINEAGNLARRKSSAAHGARVTAHLSAFVPQPQTPTQWFGSAPTDVLHRRLAILQESVAQRSVRLFPQRPETAELCAALSRGGRDMARALAAGLEAGLQPMSAAADCSADAWLKAFPHAGLDVSHYACRNIPLEETLPWQRLRFASSCDDLRTIAQGIVQSG